jgi:hypothetical protein
LAYYQHDVDLHKSIWERADKSDSIAQQRATNGTGTIFDLIQTIQITTTTRNLLFEQLFELNSLGAKIDYLTGHRVSTVPETKSGR